VRPCGAYFVEVGVTPGYELIFMKRITMTSSKIEEQAIYESELAQDIGKLAAKAVDQAEKAKDKLGQFGRYILNKKMIKVKIVPVRS
jgi:hypothetical protein